MKTLEAKKTLSQWKETYFETRAKIEASGRDARWEFDRKRLFERTDYMATICEDVHEVAQVSCKHVSTGCLYASQAVYRLCWRTACPTLSSGLEVKCSN